MLPGLVVSPLLSGLLLPFSLMVVFILEAYVALFILSCCARPLGLLLSHFYPKGWLTMVFVLFLIGFLASFSSLIGCLFCSVGIRPLRQFAFGIHSLSLTLSASSWLRASGPSPLSAGTLAAPFRLCLGRGRMVGNYYQ